MMYDVCNDVCNEYDVSKCRKTEAKNENSDTHMNIKGNTALKTVTRNRKSTKRWDDTNNIQTNRDDQRSHNDVVCGRK